MPNSAAPLEHALLDLSAGDLEIAKARTVVHLALEKGGQAVQRLYTALRGLAWRMVHAPRVAPDVDEWHDLCTHTAGRLRDLGNAGLAERIDTLAELLSQTSRFSDHQSLDDVMGRLHVSTILKALARHNGRAKRSVISRASDLGDANLSRVLAVLVAQGLVERSRAGKEAILSLTDKSWSALAQSNTSQNKTTTVRQPNLEELDLASIWWDRAGNVLAATEAFVEIMREGGLPSNTTPKRGDWVNWVDNAVLEDRIDGLVCGRSLRLTEGLWVKYLEKSLPDGVVVATLIDISSERRTEASLRKQLASRIEETSLLEEKIRKLEREVSDAQLDSARAQRRLVSAKTAVDELRGKLIANSASIAQGLQSLQMVDELRPWNRQFDVLDIQLSAIKNAIQYLLVVPIDYDDRSEVQADTWSMNELLKASVETVNPLARSNYEYVASDEQLSTAVVDGSALTMLGNLMLIHAREYPDHRVVLNASANDTSIMVMIGRKGAGKNAVVSRMKGLFQHPKVAEPKAPWTYIYDIAQSCNGEFFTEPQHGGGTSDWVGLSLPIVGYANHLRMSNDG